MLGFSCGCWRTWRRWKQLRSCNVTYGGTITTSGASSDAIKVQSIGGGGGNGGISPGSAAFTKNGGSASVV